MERGTRYTVQTRYGCFSLDEASYRDYLAGKLWINWPPERSRSKPNVDATKPLDVSAEAIQLRDKAAKQGVLHTLQGFSTTPPPPCKERMGEISIYELSLSARASNGLMRAGINTFGKLAQLMASEKGIASVRNLGTKSIKELQDAFMEECYNRLLNYEKAAFWQDALEISKGDCSGGL